MKNIIVLFSGAGSNFQSIIEKLHNPKMINICGAISNNLKAHGNNIAKDHNIPLYLIDHKKFKSLDSFNQELSCTIDKLSPDWIVLAGFMRILSDEIVNQYYGRIINIHPSLLPNHKGLDTHNKVIENSDLEHGTSVHFVSKQLDDGPIISQVKFSVGKNDTAKNLEKKVKLQEHFIYPKIISWLTTDRLKLKTNTVFLDGHPLPKTGITYPETEDNFN
ncbi:MAG: phosphoribosylglycinamide formyltransferase [Francisellaceae bacterium]|jgi:phosphoribosylglycinamide formyltransferase 1|nr:phosphoribosylglycinamide formyltransferase [Francisellaceae bacterium]MBT6538463.1 phosphoribosylglycinamide formyltransferase [Francisellaceae bacterium]